MYLEEYNSDFEKVLTYLSQYYQLFISFAYPNFSRTYDSSVPRPPVGPSVQIHLLQSLSADYRMHFNELFKVGSEPPEDHSMRISIGMC